jgi:excinuclease UvrABC nuclease subunit
MTSKGVFMSSSPYKPVRPIKYRPHENKGTPPPHKPGEYRIRTKSGKIKYIGETCDLSNRMRSHIRSGKIRKGQSFEHQIADGRIPQTKRRIHEAIKIDKHKPYTNRRAGGGGSLKK